MDRIIDKKLLKFLIVGIINTIIGMCIMFSLYNFLGCTYWISSSLNYVITSILSFFLNKYFTFGNHQRDYKQVVRFILNILVCYIIAYGLAKPLCLLLLSNNSKTIQDNISMLVGMCIFTSLNYLGQRFFTFN
ncbi:MAG: GtrA family protein [Clostridiales bacterium]|nr:GtrA family protein [Clostridiales bacterium]